MTAEAESPFGEVTLSASIPGLPFSQMHVVVKAGTNPFQAAKAFKVRFVEAFGAEEVAAAVASSKPAVAAPAASGGAPKCNVHNRAMKPSAKGGGWFCSAKLADDTYCQEKVAA